MRRKDGKKKKSRWPSDIDRFHERYIPEPMSGCWIWLKSAHKDGRGVFDVCGKTECAPRAAWILLRGPIPPGLYACHKCDNPSCVNPDHLFIGTAKDNIEDRVKKGRSADRAGQRNPGAKIKDTDVLIIRTLAKNGEKYASMAKRFGISKCSVSQIVLRKRWAHLE